MKYQFTDKIPNFDGQDLEVSFGEAFAKVIFSNVGNEELTPELKLSLYEVGKRLVDNVPPTFGTLTMEQEKALRFKLGKLSEIWVFGQMHEFLNEYLHIKSNRSD